MDIISAIAAINALIIAFLLATKKKKSISNTILVAWILNFAFHFAVPFGIERNLIFHESMWGFLMGIFVVTHAPFIFVYTSSLSNPGFKADLKHLYHFAFILLFVASFIPYLLLPPDERLEAVYQKENLSYYVLLPMLTLLFTRLYFLARTFILIFKHQYNIKQTFSYEAKINLAWIKLIAFGFLGVIVLSFVLYGFVSAKIISVFWMDYILIIANMLLFFYIAYSGYKQNTIQKDIIKAPQLTVQQNEVHAEKPTVKTSFEEEDSFHPDITRLKDLMNQEKLYLDAELNIGNVANQLNIHVHQLSKLINTQLDKNF
ncbi:MAG: hypothetical protein MI922_25750, partial [Bacteroidales bacterium]|nr:hypothetical protein [Bacteroidales bacterium]